MYTLIFITYLSDKSNIFSSIRQTIIFLNQDLYINSFGQHLTLQHNYNH